MDEAKVKMESDGWLQARLANNTGCMRVFERVMDETTIEVLLCFCGSDPRAIQSPDILV